MTSFPEQFNHALMPGSHAGPAADANIGAGSYFSDSMILAQKTPFARKAQIDQLSTQLEIDAGANQMSILDRITDPGLKRLQDFSKLEGWVQKMQAMSDSELHILAEKPMAERLKTLYPALATYPEASQVLSRISNTGYAKLIELSDADTSLAFEELPPRGLQLIAEAMSHGFDKNELIKIMGSIDTVKTWTSRVVDALDLNHNGTFPSAYNALRIALQDIPLTAGQQEAVVAVTGLLPGFQLAPGDRAELKQISVAGIRRLTELVSYGQQSQLENLNGQQLRVLAEAGQTDTKDIPLWLQMAPGDPAEVGSISAKGIQFLDQLTTSGQLQTLQRLNSRQLRIVAELGATAFHQGKAMAQVDLPSQERDYKAEFPAIARHLQVSYEKSDSKAASNTAAYNAVKIALQDVPTTSAGHGSLQRIKGLLPGLKLQSGDGMQLQRISKQGFKYLQQLSQAPGWKAKLESLNGEQLRHLGEALVVGFDNQAYGQRTGQVSNQKVVASWISLAEALGVRVGEGHPSRQGNRARLAIQASMPDGLAVRSQTVQQALINYNYPVHWAVRDNQIEIYDNGLSDTEQNELNRYDLRDHSRKALGELHNKFGTELTGKMMNASLGLVNNEDGLQAVLDVLNEVDSGRQINLTIEDLGHLRQVIINLKYISLHDLNHMAAANYGVSEIEEIPGDLYAEGVAVAFARAVNEGHLNVNVPLTAPSQAKAVEALRDLINKDYPDSAQWIELIKVRLEKHVNSIIESLPGSTRNLGFFERQYLQKVVMTFDRHLHMVGYTGHLNTGEREQLRAQIYGNNDSYLSLIDQLLINGNRMSEQEVSELTEGFVNRISELLGNAAARVNPENSQSQYTDRATQVIAMQLLLGQHGYVLLPEKDDGSYTTMSDAATVDEIIKSAPALKHLDLREVYPQYLQLTRQALLQNDLPLNTAVVANDKLITQASAESANVKKVDLDEFKNWYNGAPYESRDFYSLLTLPELEPVLNLLRNDNELPVSPQHRYDYASRLNNLEAGEYITGVLPEDPELSMAFWSAVERFGVDIQPLLWRELYNGVQPQSTMQETLLGLQHQVKTTLSPEQQNFFVHTAFAQIAILQNTAVDPQTLLQRMQAVYTAASQYTKEKNFFLDDILSKVNRMGFLSMPLSNRSDTLQAAERENGSVQYLGLIKGRTKETGLIATGAALDIRLRNELLLYDTDISANEFEARVFYHHYIGLLHGVPMYAVTTNHPADRTTLDRELGESLDFTAHDISTIRHSAAQANRRLLDAGLYHAGTNLAPENVSLNRDDNGQISSVRLRDLQLGKTGAANKAYLEAESLLNIELGIIAPLQPQVWSAASTTQESYSSAATKLGIATRDYTSETIQAEQYLNTLRETASYIGQLPEPLRGPFTAIAASFVQASGIDAAELQQLTPEHRLSLGLGNRGINSQDAVSGEMTGVDITDPSTGQTDTNTRSHLQNPFGPAGGVTNSLRLNPNSGLQTPNGLVGNNGSQAGHQPPNNNSGTITAVAGDAPEPDKAFQVINGQVVVGDNILLRELDLSGNVAQPGESLFGAPVGLPELPTYTPARQTEANAADIPVADTSSETVTESSQPSAQQQGGVTWGGDLGNDKGKTAAQLGLDPSGKLPGPEKAKAPDPIPGYGEGVNTQDLNQNNTRDWGGGPVDYDPSQSALGGFPQQDKTLENILNPEGPAGARFRFPPGNEEIPAAEYQAVVKALPALQQISVGEYSQLSAADQNNILSRAVEYQSLPADIKANTSLLQYADSGQTSASQRGQMLGVQQKQIVQTSQQILSDAQSGLSDSTIQVINSRINALQQNTAAINQQTQVLTQSNTNRQNALATPTTSDPVTAAFIKPDIKPDQTPPASNSAATTSQLNTQADPIPRFMVVRTANGPQLMENLPNGKTQMLPYPIPADTPVTRQASNGSWTHVPDAYAIGAKNLLDTLFLQSTVKMLNGGNAVQTPGAQSPSATPQAPTSLPQPAF